MIIEVALVCPSSNSLGSLLEYWGFARIFGRLYGMHDTGISINNRASIAAMDFLVTGFELRFTFRQRHSCRWIGYSIITFHSSLLFFDVVPYMDKNVESTYSIMFNL